MSVEIYKSAQEIIRKECEAVGITDKKPFEVLARLLESKKLTVDKFGGKHWEDDNLAQSRAVEMTLRLKKLLDNKVEDIKEVSVTHKMSKEDIDRLESIANELKGLERRLVNDRVQQGVIDV